MAQTSASLEALLSIEGNQANLRRLSDHLQAPSGVIPFVGAGLSMPMGFPGWTQFLCAQSRAAGVEGEIEKARAEGHYEEAADLLRSAMGPRAFEDALEEHFGEHKLRGKIIDGAVALLPRLASGPVITTNFDHVLEEFHANSRERRDRDSALLSEMRKHLPEPLAGIRPGDRLYEAAWLYASLSTRES